MPTTEASGTQTAVIGTEHSLHTNTGAKVFVFSVDTGNMVNADVLELRINTKVLTGGTVREAYQAIYANVQGEPIKESVPTLSMFSVEFTLKQTAGTGRAFDWSVVSL